MHDFDPPFDWERTVILELNRKHEYVCWLHNITLRPIAIRLFDSETRWGQFDALTRTISISRKLIHEHPWAHVVGVFMHEMAHQFVAENSPALSDRQRPHGELFKDACRRLGVPDQYTRAGVELQSANLDWRLDRHDEATDKILNKVKKLLSLANSSNEHEALLAMERVRELYARHNLERLDGRAQSGFVHLIITHGKKRFAAWEHRTISILAGHFFVTVLTAKQFDPKTCQHVRALEIIGTPENVLMAEYVYHFLLHQTQFLLEEAIRKGAPLARFERGSFRLGVLDGFASKLRQAESDKTVRDGPGPASASLTVVGQALQSFRRDESLQDYLSQVYPRLGTRRGSRVGIYNDAFSAGREVGRSITLNKPITHQSENRGHQLAGSKS